MAKSKKIPEKNKAYVIRTKEEEWALLEAQSERIRKDPEYGLEIARRAGIIDENNQLTPHYKRTTPWED